jgi:propanol-preferring alcohol dehydrogenase
VRARPFGGTNEPLRLAKPPDPIPGPGEVVIDVLAAGLCHSGVSTRYEPVAMVSIHTRPSTIGHEIAGVVSAVDNGVTAWTVGQRVGICPGSVSTSTPGFGRDGGFAEKYLSPVSNPVRVPEGLNITWGPWRGLPG